MLKQVISIEALYIFFPLIFLCFDVYGIVSQFIRISRDYKGELTPYMEISRSISTNLGGRPISDIRLVTYGDCPRTYELWHIGSWPGTKEGCYNKKNGTLLSKGCYQLTMSAEEIADWERVPTYSKEALSQWGEYQLCVQRFLDFTFANFSTSTCPYGYKPCSKGFICIPESKNYPITSIKFDWEDNGWGLVVNTERDPDQNAAMNISTSINHMPCISSEKLSKEESASKYPLENEDYQGCSKFGIDTEFSHQIDSEDLIQLYAENRLSGYYRGLPYYNEYLKGKSVFLSYKTKINLNVVPQCSPQNISRYLGDIIYNLQNFGLMTGIMTVLIAYNVIILVVGFIMLLYLCLNRENDEITKYLKEQKCLLHTFHFIPYIIGVLYIVQYSVQPEDGSLEANNIITSVSTIIDNQCFIGNQYHNIFIQFKEEIIDMTTYFFQANVTMAIVSYIFIGIMLVIRGLRGYYQREVQEYENFYFEKRFIATRTQPETELTGGLEYDIEEYEEAPYMSYEDQDDEEDDEHR